jgi:hypothetical protein
LRSIVEISLVVESKLARLMKALFTPTTTLPEPLASEIALYQPAVAV